MMHRLDREIYSILDSLPICGGYKLPRLRSNFPYPQHDNRTQWRSRASLRHSFLGFLLSKLDCSGPHTCWCYLPRMISPAEVERIKTEIEMLEEARGSSIDSGIQNQSDVLLEAHNSELERLTAHKSSHRPERFQGPSETGPAFA